LYTRSVAPGVVTAILLLLPLYVFHLRQLSSMKASTS